MAVVAYVPMLDPAVVEAAVPGGVADPGGACGFGGVAGGTGVIAVVVVLVGEVVSVLVGEVVVGLVGEVVAGLVGDDVGFGFGLEFGLYGCAVGACAVVPWAVPEGADEFCAAATVDSVAAMANARTFSG